MRDWPEATVAVTAGESRPGAGGPDETDRRTEHDPAAKAGSTRPRLGDALSETTQRRE